MHNGSVLRVKQWKHTHTQPGRRSGRRRGKDGDSTASKGKWEKCIKRNRREETVTSRVGFGHTGLNSTLFTIGKRSTGRCDYCEQDETIEHVIVNCEKYAEERRHDGKVKKGKGTF